MERSVELACKKEKGRFKIEFELICFPMMEIFLLVRSPFNIGLHESKDRYTGGCTIEWLIDVVKVVSKFEI